MKARTLVVQLDPMPSPRPRLGRGGAYMSNKYTEWKRDFKLLFGQHEVTAGLAITFYISIPQSYSKKQRAAMHLQKHKKKPDIDNLIKSVLDAITDRDQEISDIFAQKRWIDGPGKMVLVLSETLPMIDNQQTEEHEK